MGDLVDGAFSAGDFQGIGLTGLALGLIFPTVDSMIGRKDSDGFLQLFRMKGLLHAGDASRQIR